MKDFRYSAANEEAEIQSILKERKQKIAKQQIIFSLILLAIVSVLALYAVRKIMYTEFDGYLNTDYNDVRAIDDLFILELKKDIGNVVVPGDTLFSYVHLSNFKNQEDVGGEPHVVSQNRNLRMQYNLARQDAELIRVRVNEIRRQLEVEDHNLRFGLNDNTHKLELEKELAETQAELRVHERKLRVLQQAVEESRQSMKGVAIDNHWLRFENVRDPALMRRIGLVRYYVAVDTAIVTKLWVPDLSTTLKGESIIQTQSFDLHRSNLSVVGYIPVNEMHKITRNTQVEVRVTDNISFTAHVSLMGARTEVIPEVLRNRLSKDYMAVVVNFSIDPDQIIPFWVLVKNIPVTIRINNWRREKKRKVDYTPFHTTYGVVYDSITVNRKP